MRTKTTICLKVRQFPQKNGQLSGWAFTYVFEKKYLKHCLKQSTKKRIENRKLANLHRKNDVLKATMFQRHQDYYGFVKTGFGKRLHFRHTHT